MQPEGVPAFIATMPPTVPGMPAAQATPTPRCSRASERKRAIGAPRTVRNLLFLCCKQKADSSRNTAALRNDNLFSGHLICVTDLCEIEEQHFARFGGRVSQGVRRRLFSGERQLCQSGTAQG